MELKLIYWCRGFCSNAGGHVPAPAAPNTLLAHLKFGVILLPQGLKIYYNSSSVMQYLKFFNVAYYIPFFQGVNTNLSKCRGHFELEFIP
jgi:hypothetical protein